MIKRGKTSHHMHQCGFGGDAWVGKYHCLRSHKTRTYTDVLWCELACVFLIWFFPPSSSRIRDTFGVYPECVYNEMINIWTPAPTKRLYQPVFYVPIEFAFCAEIILTGCAFERLNSKMDVRVVRQRGLVFERLVTIFALELSSEKETFFKIQPLN